MQKIMWKKHIAISVGLIATLTLYVLVSKGSIANVYLSQSGAGTQDGLSCANAKPVSFFNAAGNWGGGGAQIGPGTTVHLCGNITTALSFQGSGTNGSPITLLFETGASMATSAWSGNGAIYGNGKSYIIISGGSNGVISNTDNGSSPTYGNQVDSSGIYFPAPCTNVQVTSIRVENIYVRNNPNDTSAGGDAIDIRCTDQFRVDHTVVHDSKFCTNHSWTSGTVTNIEIDHNIFYHCNWGTALGVNGNVSISTVNWHDNEVYDWQNWDDLNTNQYHHNGIHVFLEGGSGTSNVASLRVYNNYFHGNPGQRMTANIYLEANSGTISSPVVFNNVHSMETYAPTNGHINMKNNVTTPSLYNNVFDYVANLGGICMMIQGGTGVVSRNNIFTRCGLVYYIPSGTLTTSNTNDYYSNTAFGPSSGANVTLAAWQSASGLDASGSITTNPNLGAGFVPPAGSPVIGTGVDLSGLGITALNSDKNGNARTVPWTIGALNSSATAPNVSFSPTSLAFGSITVNTSNGLTTTLTNTGNADLTISSVSITGTDLTQFSQSNGCNPPSTVSPSATCVFSVQFAPTTVGSKSASLSVSDNATGSPHTVPLTGTATSAPVVNPPAPPKPILIGATLQMTCGTSKNYVTCTLTPRNATTVEFSVNGWMQPVPAFPFLDQLPVRMFRSQLPRGTNRFVGTAKNIEGVGMSVTKIITL